MFEWLEDLTSDLDMQSVGIALILWAICVVILWKFMYDPKFMKFWVKLVLTVVMLPVCYIILHVMSDR
jgi:hypothetical protein